MRVATEEDMKKIFPANADGLHDVNTDHYEMGTATIEEHERMNAGPSMKFTHKETGEEILVPVKRMISARQ